MYASADLPDEMSDCTWILVSNLTKDALEKDGIKLEMNTTAMTATIAKEDYVEEKVEKLASELRTVLNPHYDDWLKREVNGEKVESDFNDSNIISDDSVLRYIAKKIQD